MPFDLDPIGEHPQIKVEVRVGEHIEALPGAPEVGPTLGVLRFVASGAQGDQPLEALRPPPRNGSK